MIGWVWYRYEIDIGFNKCLDLENSNWHVYDLISCHGIFDIWLISINLLQLFEEIFHQYQILEIAI